MTWTAASDHQNTRAVLRIQKSTGLDLTLHVSVNENGEKLYTLWEERERDLLLTRKDTHTLFEMLDGTIKFYAPAYILESLALWMGKDIAAEMAKRMHSTNVWACVQSLTDPGMATHIIRNSPYSASTMYPLLLVYTYNYLGLAEVALQKIQSLYGDLRVIKLGINKGTLRGGIHGVLRVLEAIDAPIRPCDASDLLLVLAESSPNTTTNATILQMLVENLALYSADDLYNMYIDEQVYTLFALSGAWGVVQMLVDIGAVSTEEVNHVLLTGPLGSGYTKYIQDDRVILSLRDICASGWRFSPDVVARLQSDLPARYKKTFATESMDIHSSMWCPWAKCTKRSPGGLLCTQHRGVAGRFFATHAGLDRDCWSVILQFV